MISLGLAHRVLFIITQIEAVGLDEINETLVGDHDFERLAAPVVANALLQDGFCVIDLG